MYWIVGITTTYDMRYVAKTISCSCAPVLTPLLMPDEHQMPYISFTYVRVSYLVDLVLQPRQAKVLQPGSRMRIAIDEAK